MTKWYINEISKMTGVSVQTMHHYDRIALLKPSYRLENGYRMYSEMDLSKLQQIIALKFFGFTLKAVAELTDAAEPDIQSFQHQAFQHQAKLLERKGQMMLRAASNLKSIVSDIDSGSSIDWQTTIKLIKVYKIMEDLNKSWAGDVLTPEELKEFAKLSERFEDDTNKRQQFVNTRDKLMARAKTMLDQSPASKEAKKIAKEWMGMINHVYGPENADLKKKVWEEGFLKNKVDDKRAMDIKLVKWLDQAIDHHYRSTIYDFLGSMDSRSDQENFKFWHDLMHEMAGDSDKIRQEINQAITQDKIISIEAKNWVKSNFDS